MASKKKSAEQSKTALVLRCCAPDMTSHGGFVWPGVGEVAEAPDWKKDGQCGHGLHGWLYGQGAHDCCDYWTRENAKWLVVEVEESVIQMLGGKCKFPRGTVRFVGGMADAAEYIIKHEPRATGVAVIGANLRADDGQTAVVGARGTATAGYRGTATAGDSGTATAGDSGTATAGYRGTATAGDSGTATAGALGTATAGYRGTATAGALGTATAGYRGTATAGYSGTATAGYSGEIRVRYWDAKAERYRTVIGYVGEGGIEANVAYRLDDEHRLVKADPGAAA
jgi:hypothetical protein